MRLLPAGAGAAAASGLPQRASLSRAAPCVRGKCPRAAGSRNNLNTVANPFYITAAGSMQGHEIT